MAQKLMCFDTGFDAEFGNMGDIKYYRSTYILVVPYSVDMLGLSTAQRTAPRGGMYKPDRHGARWDLDVRV